MITRRLFAIAVLACTLTAVIALPAGAHTELEESEPAAGATLETSPPEVFLQFTERVAEGTITIEVRDPDGEPLELGETQSGARAAAVPLPPLDRNGRYTVRYEGQSEDGHEISGRFRFRLQVEDTAPATEPEPTEAEPTEADATVEPTQTPAATEATVATNEASPAAAANDDAEGRVPWAAIAAVIAALAVGLTLVLVRARQSSLMQD